MLINKSPGDEACGQPSDRFPEKKSGGVGHVLPHPNVERPGREAVAPEVVREMNEVRVVTFQGVATDVAVEENAVAENERPKDGEAGGEQHQDKSNSGAP